MRWARNDSSRCGTIAPRRHAGGEYRGPRLRGDDSATVARESACPPSSPSRKSPSASAPWWWRTRSISRSPKARRSASSGRTAPARPRCSASPAARCSPMPGASCSPAPTSRGWRRERRCRMGIGRSFQIPQPFSGMTVFENLVVAAAFGGGQGEREVYPRCVELLEQCALADKANRPAGSAHAARPQAARARARARDAAARAAARRGRGRPDRARMRSRWSS